MLQPPRQRVLMLRLLELHDQVVAVHEVGHVPAFGVLDADGHGEMGLPGAGRPHENDVLRALHEPEVPQIQDFIPVQPRLIAEIVVVERLHEREMRDHDHGSVHPVLAEGHLLLREGIEGVHQIRSAAVDLVYEGVDAGPEGGQFQGIEVVDQLDVVRHRTHSPRFLNLARFRWRRRTFCRTWGKHKFGRRLSFSRRATAWRRIPGTSDPFSSPWLSGLWRIRRIPSPFSPIPRR